MTLTPTGASASVADFQAALRAVKYANTSDTPNTRPGPSASRYDDGQPTGHASNTVTRTIDVVATNDAPVAGDETFNATNSAVGNTSLRQRHHQPRGPRGRPDGDAGPDRHLAGHRPPAQGDHRRHPGQRHRRRVGEQRPHGRRRHVRRRTTAARSRSSPTATSSSSRRRARAAPTTATSSTTRDRQRRAARRHGTDTGRVTIAHHRLRLVRQQRRRRGQQRHVREAVRHARPGGDRRPATGALDLRLRRQRHDAAGYNAGVAAEGATSSCIGEAATLTVGSRHAAQRRRGQQADDDEQQRRRRHLAGGTTVKGLNIDPQGTGGGISGRPSAPPRGTIDDINITDAGTKGTQPGLELGTARAARTNISNLTVNNGDGNNATSTRRGRPAEQGRAPSTSPRPARSRSRPTAPRASTRRGGGTTNLGTGSVVRRHHRHQLRQRRREPRRHDRLGTTFGDARHRPQLTTTSGQRQAAFSVQTAGTFSVNSGGRTVRHRRPGGRRRRPTNDARASTTSTRPTAHRRHQPRRPRHRHVHAPRAAHRAARRGSASTSTAAAARSPTRARFNNGTGRSPPRSRAAPAAP